MLKCARTACQAELPQEGPYYAIYNDPSTGGPRLYCTYCGRKIIDGNRHDDLKLAYEIRRTVTVTPAATPPQEG